MKITTDTFNVNASNTTIKGFATSNVIRTQSWTAPAIYTDEEYVHATIALPETGPLEVTTGITNPDCARCLNIVAQAGAPAEASEFTIEGTDIEDTAISETFTFGVGSTLKAFKTVTKITLPQRTTVDDTVSLGINASLGLDTRCQKTAAPLHAVGYQGDVPWFNTADLNFYFDPVDIAKNTWYANPDQFKPDGATDVTLYYIPDASATPYSGMEKIATVDNVDVTQAGAIALVHIPAGKKYIHRGLFARVTSYNAGSKTSDAHFDIGSNDPDYDNHYSGWWAAIVAAETYASFEDTLDAGAVMPIHQSGDTFKMNITTPSDADVEVWSVDVFGYFVDA